MSDYKGFLKETFKDNLAIINGEEYVHLDVFLQATSELALSDAVIGALALKYGSFDVTEDEIMEFMGLRSNEVTAEFKEGVYKVRRTTSEK